MSFFSRTPAVAKPAKISMATLASRTFVQRFHIPKTDRGTVHTFGNTHRVETPLDTDPARVHQGLDFAERAVKSGANEGTRFYAAVTDAITYFINNGDPRYPWVPIVVTDGMDNRSKVADFDLDWADKQQLVPNARFAGRYIARGLAALGAIGIVCRPVVVGVGSDKQIDVNAIHTLGQTGGFPTFHIGSFDKLADLLTDEVTKIVVTKKIIGHRVGGYDLLTTHNTAHLQRFPVEYAIIVDRSGSMNNAE